MLLFFFFSLIQMRKRDTPRADASRTLTKTSFARSRRFLSVSLFCSQGVSRFIRYVHPAARTDTVLKLARAKCDTRTARGRAPSSVSCCSGNVAFARTTRLTDPPVCILVFRSHSTGFKSSRDLSLSLVLSLTLTHAHVADTNRDA